MFQAPLVHFLSQTWNRTFFHGTHSSLGKWDFKPTIWVLGCSWLLGRLLVLDPFRDHNKDDLLVFKIKHLSSYWYCQFRFKATVFLHNLLFLPPESPFFHAQESHFSKTPRIIELEFHIVSHLFHLICTHRSLWITIPTLPSAKWLLKMF